MSWQAQSAMGNGGGINGGDGNGTQHAGTEYTLQGEWDVDIMRRS
jgi:hypothetical protein